MKKKVFIWSDMVVPTGFANVAKNLFRDLHSTYDVEILGINYHGLDRYDTDKWFIYPTSPTDPLGLQKLPELLSKSHPDVIILFQDIFHIDLALQAVKHVAPNVPVISYFPVDGEPFSMSWERAVATPDIAITYSDFAIRAILDTFPNLAKKNIRKLYHGVDTAIFHPLDEKEIKLARIENNWTGKFVVCNINRFQPRKMIPMTLRAFALFNKGYNICKCGNWYLTSKPRCDLNGCSRGDIIKTRPPRPDALLYLHMVVKEPTMGPGKANLLQAHLINAGFTNKDVPRNIALNASNIYDGSISDQTVNKIYNASNVNISSSLGEGKLARGTLVRTPDGYIPIQDVKEDTLVYTQRRKYRRVNKTLATEFTLPRYQITLEKFSEPFICSHDHPFLAADNKTFITADKLTVGTTLRFNVVKPNLREILFVDLAKDVGMRAITKITPSEIYIGSKKRIARFLPATEELYRIFGIAYTTPRHKEIKKFFRENVNINGHLIHVPNIFSNFHPWIAETEDKKLREAYMEGLLHESNTIIAKSRSDAFLLRDFFHSLAKDVSVEGRQISLLGSLPARGRALYIKLNVEEIEILPPGGMGYDLEVPDGESYTIGQVVAHNCGLSLLESAATGMKSIAPNNSAIPEMLGDEQYLIPNVAHVNIAMDNAHVRPVVDVRKMVEALEAEYQIWKKHGKKRIVYDNLITRIKNQFSWDDKRQFIEDAIKEVLK